MSKVDTRKQEEHKSLKQWKNSQVQDLFLHRAGTWGSLLTVSRKQSITMIMFSPLLGDSNKQATPVTSGQNQGSISTLIPLRGSLGPWADGQDRTAKATFALSPSHLKLLWSLSQGLYSSHFYYPKTPCTHQLHPSQALKDNQFNENLWHTPQYLPLYSDLYSTSFYNSYYDSFLPSFPLFSGLEEINQRESRRESRQQMNTGKRK